MTNQDRTRKFGKKISHENILGKKIVECSHENINETDVDYDVQNSIVQNQLRVSKISNFDENWLSRCQSRITFRCRFFLSLEMPIFTFPF